MSLRRVTRLASMLVSFKRECAKMNFDETVSDLSPLIDPEAPWLPKAESNEPDLDVDGLPGSLMARLLGLFTRSSP